MTCVRPDANAVNSAAAVKACAGTDSRGPHARYPVVTRALPGKWQRHVGQVDLRPALRPGAVVSIALMVPEGRYLYDLSLEAAAGKKILRLAFPATPGTHDAVVARLPDGADSLRIAYGAETPVNDLAVVVSAPRAPTKPGGMATALRLARQGRIGEILRRAAGRLVASPPPAFPQGGAPGSVPARRVGSPPRAVMFSHSLDLEGAPISQFELVSALHRAGVVDPVIVAPADGPLRHRYEAEGIRVVRRAAPTAGFPSPRQYARRMAALAAFVAGLAPAIVYANTARSFFAIEAAKALGLPSLWNLREAGPWHGELGDLPPYLQARIAHCFGAATRVVFVAEATRRDWAGLGDREGIAVIPNALVGAAPAVAGEDRRELVRGRLGASPGEVVALSVGTLCARKGQEDALRAISRLGANIAAGMRLVFVGGAEPGYQRRLRRLVSGLPADRRQRVSFLPATAEIAGYLSAADIFLCSSRLESYPRVVLEAMAASLPIITTPVCGIPEQVSDGTSALFYAPGDAAALAGALTRLVGDSGLRAELARGARQAFDDLGDFDNMQSAYAGVIGDLGPMTREDT